MFKLKPLIQKKDELVSSNIAYITKNRFLTSKLVKEYRYPECEYQVDLFEMSEDHLLMDDIAYSVNDEILISNVRIDYDIPEELFSKTYERLKNLPEDNFEIRPQDHIKTIEDNFVDLWGEPTLLMKNLVSHLQVSAPPFNNNKVFSNRDDHFTLENLHVDSFYEMRNDEKGNRFKVWRYFLNLGSEARKSVVGLHHPNMVDYHLDKHYQEDHLGKFLQACQYCFPALVLNLKARTHQSIYGFKILASHLLHAPYNKKDDFLAVINTIS